MSALPSTPFPGRSGGSAAEGKDVLAQWFRELEPRLVVDVGAGQGVYGRLVRAVVPWVRVVGVEVFYPSVREYGLDAVYDELIIGDARWLDWGRVFRMFHPDVVVCGDVLEHLPSDDAVDLVETITWHMVPVFVSVPIVEWPQGEVDGNPFEEHVTHWSDEGFRRTFSPYRGVRCDPVGVYWVR